MFMHIGGNPIQYAVLERQQFRYISVTLEGRVLKANPFWKMAANQSSKEQFAIDIANSAFSQRQPKKNRI